jgi:hypothetical protein
MNDAPDWQKEQQQVKNTVVRQLPEAPEAPESIESIESKEDKERRRREKWQYKIDRIKAITAKALAVAKKRKWLVLLIGIGIAAYSIISSGGLSGMGGIIDKLKGLFN